MICWWRGTTLNTEQHREALITHLGCSLLKSDQVFRVPLSLFKFRATGPIGVIWLTSLEEEEEEGEAKSIVGIGPLIYEEVGKIRLNRSLIQTHPFPLSPNSHHNRTRLTLRRVWETIVAVKSTNVCSRSYPACKARAPYYILWFVACPSLPYFSTLIHKWNDFRGKKIM
jgi:hypothetical protein